MFGESTTLASFEHPEKTPSPNWVTLGGMTMVVKLLQFRNAPSSRLTMLDGSSMPVTLRPQNALWKMCVTPEGSWMLVRPPQSTNAQLAIVVTPA
jgi:hypothetical protein